MCWVYFKKGSMRVYQCIIRLRIFRTKMSYSIFNNLIMYYLTLFLSYLKINMMFNPFVLPNLEPKCAPGDPILYPESIFCYSP